jgi:hypothetical protein
MPRIRETGVGGDCALAVSTVGAGVDTAFSDHCEAAIETSKVTILRALAAVKSMAGYAACIGPALRLNTVRVV